MTIMLAVPCKNNRNICGKFFVFVCQLDLEEVHEYHLDEELLKECPNDQSTLSAMEGQQQISRKVEAMRGAIAANQLHALWTMVIT